MDNLIIYDESTIKARHLSNSNAISLYRDKFSMCEGFGFGNADAFGVCGESHRASFRGRVNRLVRKVNP